MGGSLKKGAMTESELGDALRMYAEQEGLIFLEGHGWWLKERPYPPANYYPEDSLKQLRSERLPKA
jgi:hypothetical protein